jgi:rubredoxin
MGNPEVRFHDKGVRQVSEGLESSAAGAEEFVRFWAAGDRGKGEFRCSECAYGVTVHTTLPVCPMCAGESWEQVPWSPFSRARRRL